MVSGRGGGCLVFSFFVGLFGGLVASLFQKLHLKVLQSSLKRVVRALFSFFRIMAETNSHVAYTNSWEQTLGVRFMVGTHVVNQFAHFPIWQH